MINLGKDINEGLAKLNELKVQVRAERPVGPDVPPKGAILTGYQIYLQFCYRMAKFDSEFTQVDPVIGSSWINVGLTRLLNEFEKRMLADDSDRAIHNIFAPYIHIRDLEREVNPNFPFGEYHFDLPLDDKEKNARPLPDKLEIMLKLNKPCSVKDDFPKWWPVKEYTDSTGKVYYDGDIVNTGYIELDGMKYKNKNFYVSNSLSSVRDGIRTKPYIHRQAGGFPVYVYLDSWENQQRTTKSYMGRYDVPNQDLGGYFSCEGVRSTIYLWGEMMKDYSIDTYSYNVQNLPGAYHNAVVDYAIDAYFESMFFHQFGKYSMKQAREDAETTGTAQSNTAMRQGKMDAVPPNRFKMTGPNAG